MMTILLYIGMVIAYLAIGVGVSIFNLRIVNAGIGLTPDSSLLFVLIWPALVFAGIIFLILFWITSGLIYVWRKASVLLWRLSGMERIESERRRPK